MPLTDTRLAHMLYCHLVTRHRRRNNVVHTLSNSLTAYVTNTNTVPFLHSVRSKLFLLNSTTSISQQQNIFVSSKKQSYTKIWPTKLQN